MLTLHLKKHWFEKIKSGEKTHEYREVKPYWTVRIKNEIKRDVKAGQPYIELLFVNGYNFSDCLRAKVFRINKRKTGLNTDLKINKPVYDIEFELIKEKQ